MNRYKTYDSNTDTFQPYKGRRKHCNSRSLKIALTQN
ncbi:MAG: BA14K family protein [Hyphomicrobiales bacterium]